MQGDARGGKECDFWRKGNCKYGSNCRFRHSESPSKNLSTANSTKQQNYTSRSNSPKSAQDGQKGNHGGRANQVRMEVSTAICADGKSKGMLIGSLKRYREKYDCGIHFDEDTKTLTLWPKRGAFAAEDLKNLRDELTLRLSDLARLRREDCTTAIDTRVRHNLDGLVQFEKARTGFYCVLPSVADGCGADLTMMEGKFRKHIIPLFDNADPRSLVCPNMQFRIGRLIVRRDTGNLREHISNSSFESAVPLPSTCAWEDLFDGFDMGEPVVESFFVVTATHKSFDEKLKITLRHNDDSTLILVESRTRGRPHLHS
jgi:hypothetical protein